MCDTGRGPGLGRSCSAAAVAAAAAARLIGGVGRLTLHILLGAGSCGGLSHSGHCKHCRSSQKQTRHLIQKGFKQTVPHAVSCTPDEPHTCSCSFVIHTAQATVVHSCATPTAVLHPQTTSPSDCLGGLCLLQAPCCTHAHRGCSPRHGPRDAARNTCIDAWNPKLNVCIVARI
jgi:hypothetical protein